MARAIENPAVRKKACETAAEIVRDEAKRLAPTGKTLKLRDGISDEYSESDKCSYIGWDDDGYYGIFHEQGTRKMPPHPHMRPAMQNKQDEAMEAMIKVYQKEME